jgi:hypothetical protein
MHLVQTSRNSNAFNFLKAYKVRLNLYPVLIIFKKLKILNVYTKYQRMSKSLLMAIINHKINSHKMFDIMKRVNAKLSFPLSSMIGRSLFKT